MEQFKLDSKFADKNGEILVIELNGYIDHTNSDRLQKMFKNVAESDSYKIIVDFSGLEYMSSVGWGIFVGEIKRFRDNGGDIKLTRMKPEIYDVFQMLEFFHIFEDYPSIKDAFDSFEMMEGNELNYLLDTSEAAEEVTKVESVDLGKEEIDADTFLADSDSVVAEDETAAELDFTKPAEPNYKNQSGAYQEDFESVVRGDSSNLANLPVAEKVKQVIARQPLLSVFGIKKVLKHEQFGYTKIGLFKLLGLLKSMDLNSKTKRYRFYRSC